MRIVRAVWAVRIVNVTQASLGKAADEGVEVQLPRPRQALRSARVAALCWHRAPPPLNSDRILRLSKTVLDKNSELYWSDHIFNDLLFEFYRSTTSGTNDF